MTTRTVETPRLIGVRLAAGLVTGLLAGFAAGRLLRLAGVKRGELRWSDDLAMLTGVMLLSAAAYLTVLAADRRRLARALECDASEPASDDEAGQFRLQALVLALAGALIAAPVPLSGLVRGNDGVGVLAAAGVIGGLVLQTVANRRLWASADEWVRGVTRSAATIAFFVGQGALFAWGVAEKLAGAPPLTAWDAAVALTGLYLLASAVLTVRVSKRF